MAKYSTGRSSGGSGDSCELCGRTSESLTTTTVAGARLEVCSECASHGDGDDRGSDRDETRDRRRRAARNAARMSDASKGDSTRWEREGTNYDDDPLPYLVTGYGERVTEARQAAGMTRAELADALGVDEETVVAVEQGRATRAGVGGSVVAAIEDELGIELTED